MSRTIFALALALGLVAAAGCGGSKPEPTLPKADLNPDAPQPQPPAPPGPTPPDGGPPKVEPPKPTEAAWQSDQTKHAVPAYAVKGRIGGADVTPAVQIEGDELRFSAKVGNPPVERAVKLKLAPMLVVGQPLPPVLNRAWAVKLDTEPGSTVPEIWREVAGQSPHVYPSGYALTLELGARKGGKVPGKIYLSLVDDEKSFLAGTFEAAYSRPHTERPGTDDAPYVGGEVTVTGAKPGAEVRVAYAAFAPTGVFFKELQLPFDPVPELQAKWIREGDAERVSTFVAGDGKGRPFRYEHTKLPPGRYLISATVVDGPAAWKWVDVPAGGALTENITLDATKIGGAEVSVPADLKGKVMFAPADDPAKPALDGVLFQTVAYQAIRKDADIVAGKAVVKDLAPGKYEVRAGDLRGFVDVVAGKTVDLVLMPPKK
jgi:hypothetical protein